MKDKEYISIILTSTRRAENLKITLFILRQASFYLIDMASRFSYTFINKTDFLSHYSWTAMKHILNDEERSRLDKQIVEAEKRTGAQIVLAVIGRSDAYAEIPWKAFALGASLAGLWALLMNISWPLTSPGAAVLLAVVTVLTAGAGLALLCIFSPDFARLFLHAHRADVETRQYAESLFLSRQLFATRERTSVLLLISLFERRVVVLPDTGLTKNLNQETIEDIIKHMRPYLATGRTAHALEAGLKKLEEFISAKVHLEPPVNELPDSIIEEKGE